MQSATESMTTDEETDDYLADYQLKKYNKSKSCSQVGPRGIQADNIFVIDPRYQA